MLYPILVFAQTEATRPRFSWTNVQEDNGIAIAIVGMVIVFLALTLISLFIAVLPNLLKTLEPILPQSSHSVPSLAESTPVDEEMVVAAIGIRRLHNPFMTHTAVT